MSTARIAIVGAGKGGKALLKDLIKIRGISIRWVCDVNNDAEGMVFARENGIRTCLWDDVISVMGDTELDLILEVTGQQKVFRYLSRYRLPTINIMSSAASKIIFHFIDTQQKVTDELEEYKNGLETKIQERTEEIAWTNKELQRRIGDIEKLNEKLQQINDAKTKYLLQATHQLKAPFAAIQSYVDVLLQGFAGQITEQASEIIVKIKVRCQMLSRAIKNMLELANLNSYVEENVRMQETPLGEIVQAAQDSFRVVAEKRNITLHYSNSAKSDKIRCNREQVMIMITNILENAIVYSPDNTQVDLTVADAGAGRISVAIADKGIGIPEQNIPKIFQEYFRSNNAVRHYENGTGLGLSIVKKIADIHKAEIEVESGIDKGTTVRILVPASQNPKK